MKAKQKQLVLFQEKAAGTRTTEAEGLAGRSVQTDHAVVKGSSKSMEEVTRVSHFVDHQERKASERKGGGEVGPLVERVILPSSS